MARQYHITLDDDLAAFVEGRRERGERAKQVFVSALESYRAELARLELEALLERGYAESAEEDFELLREFRDVDREAEALENRSSEDPGGKRKRLSGPPRSGGGKRAGKHASVPRRVERRQ